VVCLPPPVSEQLPRAVVRLGAEAYSKLLAVVDLLAVGSFEARTPRELRRWFDVLERNYKQFDQKSLFSPYSDVLNEEIIGANPDRLTLVFARLEAQLVAAGSLLEAETAVVRIFNRLESRHDPDISQRPGFAVDHGFQSDVVAASLHDCEDNGFLLVPNLVARDCVTSWCGPRPSSPSP
jgi:hypothetical protein